MFSIIGKKRRGNEGSGEAERHSPFLWETRRGFDGKISRSSKFLTERFAWFPKRAIASGETGSLRPAAFHASTVERLNAKAVAQKVSKERRRSESALEPNIGWMWRGDMDTRIEG
jgi:hypothetical protein